MTRSDSSRWDRTRLARAPGAVLLVALLAGCATTPVRQAVGPCDSNVERLPNDGEWLDRMSIELPEDQPPFSVSLVPTVPVPIRLDTTLGFRLSSSTAGYGSLYVIDPSYRVQVLAENLSMAAGSLEYPSSQGFTLRASQPVGFNRAIMLVTRQPFRGFAGDATVTTPVELAIGGRNFVRQLNDATSTLPRLSWAADEVCLRVVGVGAS